VVSTLNDSIVFQNEVRSGGGRVARNALEREPLIPMVQPKKGPERVTGKAKCPECAQKKLTAVKRSPVSLPGGGKNSPKFCAPRRRQFVGGGKNVRGKKKGKGAGIQKFSSQPP